MAENIKISVALAACNGARYIAEQLQSLLEQSLTPDEIIITDDSMDDLTYGAILPFLPCGKIRYLKNPTPLGVAKNFEKAISLARGEVIFLCDQDDFWLPEKIATLYHTLQTNPDIDGVFCNSTLVNSDLEPCGGTLWNLRQFSAAMQKQLNSACALKVFLKRVTCSSHNIAFKRRALEYLLPFPELAPFYPDTFIALSIAANSRWRAIAQELTLYRLHGSNESSPAGGGLTSARRARANHAALRNALLAEEIIARTPDKLPSATRSTLQKFAEFHHRRDTYSSNIAVRTLQVLNQMLKLNYYNFAGNLRTIIADIIIST